MACNHMTATVTAYVMVTLLAISQLSHHTSALPLEESDIEKESMLLSKYMSLMNRLQARRAETGDLGDMVGPSFVQQKRYKSPMQSRSGGMSLCLWKVCPAAPWLISKK